MTSLLIKLFVKDCGHPELPHVRLSYGLLTGYAGIAVNIFLFAVKFAAGILSGSVAMAADAINNLSDAGSSLIAVLGFRLSAKPPDNEHPFGHGRFEYVAAVIIAVVIISVGLEFLKESVMRIFSPVKVDANVVVLAIFGGTILFKVWLFLFYRTIGKRIDSKILQAAALDSLSDILATSVVLGAVFAARFTYFPVDGIAGTAVAGLVVCGGIKVLRGAINPLLGECPDRQIVDELRGRLLKCGGIKGVHDIIIHNYGPNRFHATAHAEISRESDLASAHDMLEAAEVEIAKSMPVRLTLHCDPYNTQDPTITLWRARMEEAVSGFDSRFKLYDFHLEDGEKTKIHCHLLVPRNYSVPYGCIRKVLTEKMRRYDPTLTLEINFFNTFV